MPAEGEGIAAVGALIGASNARTTQLFHADPMMSDKNDGVRYRRVFC
jgi:hypothetical protein